MSTQLIILAAGNGSRLNSSHPKALTIINEKSSIFRILDTFNEFVDKILIVVSKKNITLIKKNVLKSYPHLNIDFCIQVKQDGILDAIESTVPFLKCRNTILIWCDQPCYTKKIIHTLNNFFLNNKLDILVPCAYKNDCYVELVLDSKRNIVKVLESREGDYISKSALGDGGLFFLKTIAFNKLIKKAELVSPGRVTLEKNFLKLLCSKIINREFILRLFEIDSFYTLGFNTIDEIISLSSKFKELENDKK